VARDLGGDRRAPGAGDDRNHAELPLDSHHLYTWGHACAHAHDEHSHHAHDDDSYDEHPDHHYAAERKIRLLAGGGSARVKLDCVPPPE
jgi:hypothetical protein